MRKDARVAIAEQPSDHVAEAPQLDDRELQESPPPTAQPYVTHEPKIDHTYLVRISQ